MPGVFLSADNVVIIAQTDSFCKYKFSKMQNVPF